MFYTHNLKIILLNKKDKIIENDTILNKIKDELCLANIHIIAWNGKEEKILIKWDIKQINEIDKYLMGDLFASPIYEHDSIIDFHTSVTLKKLENQYNYKIKYYISRIIGDKIINKESIGIIN